MKSLLMIVLATMPVVADDEPDIENMQGSWEVATFTFNGVTKSNDMGVTLRIEGNTVTIVNPNGPAISGLISLDQKKTPKEFDLQIEKTPNGKPFLMRGIYKISGQNMKWCLTIDEKTDRPKEFKAAKGDKCRIDNYKRK